MNKRYGNKDDYHHDEANENKSTASDDCKRDKGHSTKRSMVRHIEVDNGKRYVCEEKICNSFLKSRSGLKNHKLVHSGLGFI